MSLARILDLLQVERDHLEQVHAVTVRQPFASVVETRPAPDGAAPAAAADLEGTHVVGWQTRPPPALLGRMLLVYTGKRYDADGVAWLNARGIECPAKDDAYTYHRALCVGWLAGYVEVSTGQVVNAPGWDQDLTWALGRAPEPYLWALDLVLPVSTPLRFGGMSGQTRHAWALTLPEARSLLDSVERSARLLLDPDEIVGVMEACASEGYYQGSLFEQRDQVETPQSPPPGAGDLSPRVLQLLGEWVETHDDDLVAKIVATVTTETVAEVGGLSMDEAAEIVNASAPALPDVAQVDRERGARGGAAPDRAVAAPGSPSGPAPATFTMPHGLYAGAEVRPVVRMGDPSDPGGEKLWVELVADQDLPEPTGRFDRRGARAGYRFRVPCRPHPSSVHPALTGVALRAALAAPHLKQTLGSRGAELERAASAIATDSTGSPARVGAPRLPSHPQADAS